MTKDRLALFHGKVERAGSGCWLWTGSLTPNGGYPLFWNGERLQGAHRWSYAHYVGAIPEGYHVDHLCRVRRCVNPEHLEAVTPLENARRTPPGQRGKKTGALQRAKTHCPQGHEYSPENTAFSYGGGFIHRHCKTCMMLRAREKRRRLRATPTWP